MHLPSEPHPGPEKMETSSLPPVNTSLDDHPVDKPASGTGSSPVHSESSRSLRTTSSRSDPEPGDERSGNLAEVQEIERPAENDVPRPPTPITRYPSVERLGPPGEAKQLKSYLEYIETMEDRVARIEKRLRKLDEDGVDLKKSDKKPPKHIPVIPKMRRVRWFEFKNKFSEDDKPYAIELLTGPARYFWQLAADKKKNKRMIASGEQQTEDAKEPTLPADKSPSLKELPERIRINSMPIVTLMGEISSEDWALEPTLVLRPFKILIYHEKAIRDHLSKLETKWGAIEKEETEKANAESTDSKNDEPSPVNLNSPKDIPSSAFHESPRQTSSTLTPSVSAVEVNAVPEVKPKLPDQQATPTENATSPADTDGGARSDPSNANETPNFPKSPKSPKMAPTTDELIDSVEALRDIRCLVEFMDNEVFPVANRFKDGSCRTIRFNELWHLYKPGDEVFAPLGKKSTSTAKSDASTKGSAARHTETVLPGTQKTHKRYQSSWRVLSTANGRTRLSAEDDEGDGKPKQPVDAFLVDCYYLDFDGKRVRPITHTFAIPPFEEERDVTSLEIYPWQFVDSAAEIRNDLKKRGEAFRRFATSKHSYCSGPSLLCHPCGCPIFEFDKKHVENIESEVIVDFNEALQSDRDWVLNTSLAPLSSETKELNETYPKFIWKDHDTKEIDREVDEFMHYDDYMDRVRSREFSNKEPFLKDDNEPADPDAITDIEFRDKDIILLPNRVFAFVLKTRKFALVRVEDLRAIKPQLDGFNNLKLQPGHKTMVQALVRSHFTEKVSKMSEGEEALEFDLVRGKGKGLIVLLHGAPGTGKTSTAECVAAANGKPLFPITCGDLGLSAPDVERELNDIFHLAQQWDCVLLLDEADVFLAQRTKTDLKRNSLVSVFLRVLEYYTGILFLTTNRVGAFDEAFKSRIHMSLYYPPLDEAQTYAIWEMNLDRTVKRKQGMMDCEKGDIMNFAIAHYRDTFPTESNWNGRQIRNAFITASSLAEYEKTKEDKRRKAESKSDVPFGLAKLERKHFVTVAQASQDFDDYIAKTIGQTDAERALNSSERADNFRSSRIAYQQRDQAMTFRGGLPPVKQNQYQWPQQANTGEPSYPAMQQLGPPQVQPSVPGTTPPMAQRFAQGQPGQPGPPSEYPYKPVQQPGPSPQWPQSSIQHNSESMSYQAQSSQATNAGGSRWVPGSPSGRRPIDNLPRQESRRGYYEDDDF
ncbi:MAG: hypothetical protein M1819_005576 [Sarea resinae]|nr:MAG: hypothetical protein M1819_005576 [Sarea resinae]